MSSRLKCLLIEDEPVIAHSIASCLLSHGHAVVAAADGEAGLSAARAEPFSIVIVDADLPGRFDGYAVADRIRSGSGELPIVLLTRGGTRPDVVRALDNGVDDVVRKPLDVDELEARVRALARRTRRHAPGVVQFGPLQLDGDRRIAWRDGEPLELTPTEFDLLAHLVAHAERTVPRAELLSAVWGMDFDPGTRVIDVHVANLRRKLEADDYVRIVTTVRGVGFRAVRPALRSDGRAATPSRSD